MTQTAPPRHKTLTLTCSRCGLKVKRPAADKREVIREFYKLGWRGDVAEGRPLCPECARAALVTVPRGGLIKIPAHVAVCPKCDAPIAADIDEWKQQDDGTWTASMGGIHINCTTEPDIDRKEWREWLDWHWSTPYIDWLPLEERMRRWVNDHYRFDMDKDLDDQK